MAIKRGHETSTSDPGATPVHERVKVADLLQNSRMERQVDVHLPATDKRQEPPQLRVDEEKIGESVIASVQRAKGEIKGKSMEAKANALQTSVIEDLMSQKVLQHFIELINSISPSARTELKTKLTKKHRKRRAKQTLSALTISDTPNYGVPRTSVIINNMRVEAKLDGGSTVCIVSLKLVEMLGISELKATNRSQGMADGRRVFALGVVRNLKITIANKNITTAEACVFDEPGYDLLLDRMTLTKLRVGMHWYTNFWYIKTNIGTVPININYNEAEVKLPVHVEKNYDDEESDSDADSTIDSNLSTEDTVDSAYHIMSASNSEPEDEIITKREHTLLISEANSVGGVNTIRGELKKSS
ncbi:unnamed protein product [Umbelopsis ramanniana]